jgi:hypothetical protein
MSGSARSLPTIPAQNILNQNAYQPTDNYQESLNKVCHEYDGAYALESITYRMDKLAEKIATFGMLQENMIHHFQKKEENRDESLAAYSQGINKQMHDIHFLMTEFKMVMSQAGLARFRVTAEEALTQGKEHVSALEQQSEFLQTQLNAACDRFENLTQQAESRISRVVRSFRLEYFKHLVEEGSQQVEQVSESAMQRIMGTGKWFQWEKFTVALIVALIVAIVMSLFMNDEWPWESHNKVLNEREAGKMLIEAWPVLSNNQRHQIEEAVMQHQEKVAHLVMG